MKSLNDIFEGIFDIDDNIKGVSDYVKVQVLFNDILKHPVRTISSLPKFLRKLGKKIPRSKMTYDNNYVRVDVLRSGFGMTYEVEFFIGDARLGNWQKYFIRADKLSYKNNIDIAVCKEYRYEKGELKIGSYYDIISTEIYIMPDEWMSILKLIEDYEKST